jgi:hypothetical protein
LAWLGQAIHAARWHDWNAVKAVARDCAVTIFDRIIGRDDARDGTQAPPPKGSQ